MSPRDAMFMQNEAPELTEAHVDAMGRDGFVVAPGFFSAEQASDFSNWTDELVDTPERSGSHWVYREASRTAPSERLIQRIENFCPFHRGFADIIERGALRNWASALMGGPVVLFKDKINFKMPGSAGFLAHQDQQAGWGTYAPIFITAMVSIDATTPENGCLEMAPRQYGQGLIGEEWTPLEEDPLHLRALPTTPGDVVFFDSFVPHASKPNATNAARRVLYLTFNLERDGDQRARYFADKHAAFPPDIDRDPNTSYVFRV